LTYIKTKYPDKLEQATTETWRSIWKYQEDVSKPEMMRLCLSRTFSAPEVDEIMNACNLKEVKDGLLATTDVALAGGAYGCPWFEVTNSAGVKEPFFGSDRFTYMLQFLDIPFRDVEIVEREKARV
jgi:glutathione S-transferase kappa 1